MSTPRAPEQATPLTVNNDPELPAYPTPDPRLVLHPPVSAQGFDEVGSGLRLDADVVIVGSGPGGAAVARVLAQGGMRVVVLEEGPAQSRFRPNQANVARFHMQEGGTMVAQGSAPLPIAAGRGVGGGSLINSALCFRCPDAVLDDWATRLNDPSWSASRMAPLFDELGAAIGVGITPERVAGENNLLIVRGMHALGLKGGLAPRNTPGCQGCGICNFGCPVGGKGSMNLTLLPAAMAHDTRIQAETRVHTILEEDGRAAGVVGVAIHPDTGEEGGTVEVRAPHVFICAGGIGTPRLLWQAGLGERLGPVGEGLHVHPGNAVIGRCPFDVKMWTGATQGAYFHHPDHPGVLPHTFAAPPEVCLAATGMMGPDLADGLALLPKLCGLVIMVSDKGTGRVRAGLGGRAAISYDFDPADIDRIKGGMVLGAQVLMAGGATAVTAPVHGVGWCDSPEELEERLSDRVITDFVLYAAHPMSTCRMSREAGQGVVGPTGAAWGLPGLFLADSSVFPTSLGVNPQYTTMVTATQIARRLLEHA